MGSGVSGLYSDTVDGSQPYARLYGVVPMMHERDKRDKTIWDDEEGYLKNSSAVNIADAATDHSIVYQGHKANGWMTYVVDSDGNLIFGKRDNPINTFSRTPHPMLIGGKDPKVQVAGMIEFRGGKIYDIDVRSGHFRPARQSLEAAERVLSKLPKGVFHKRSRWRA